MRKGKLGHHWIGRRQRRAHFQSIHLGDPRAVRRDLVSIKWTDQAFGLRSVFPAECSGIVDVLASYVAQHLRLQKTDAQTASCGRVSARPRVTDSREAGDDGLTIDDKSPESVENPR
jgi:hypothetical protein